MVLSVALRAVKLNDEKSECVSMCMTYMHAARKPADVSVEGNESGASAAIWFSFLPGQRLPNASHAIFRSFFDPRIESTFRSKKHLNTTI